MHERKPVRQVILRDFGEIGRYRVRLVGVSDAPGARTHLDIREYVRGANYEGFTRKGIRLNRAEALALHDTLAKAVEAMAE